MVFIIGISGISTSGKSSIASELSKSLNCKIICVDHYFKINSELPKIKINEKEFLNFDSIDSIEWNYFIDDINKRINDQFLIIEGFILFGDQVIKKLLNLLIYIEFLENDFEIALQRRFNRNNFQCPLNLENIDPKSSEYNLFIYFKEVVWPFAQKNPNLVFPNDFNKPFLKLNAKDPLEFNIEQSKAFVKLNLKKCILI